MDRNEIVASPAPPVTFCVRVSSPSRRCSDFGMTRLPSVAFSTSVGVVLRSATVASVG
jgi:hypothetical protein